MPETLTACPICKSKRIVSKRRREFAVSVYNCRDCDQYFVNPRMSDDELTAYYSGEYWTAMSSQDDGLSTNNLVRHRERARYQIITLADWLADLHTVLEIGCSVGYLLDYLHTSYGMDTMGVEPDTRHHNVSPAKYHKIVTDVSLLPSRQFDLLALSHSLEHLNHPLEFMTSLIAHHAHEGTRILIEVPNLELPEGYVMSNRHPFAFTEATLNKFMARLGYAPLYFTRHGLGGIKPHYLLGMYERLTIVL